MKRLLAVLLLLLAFAPLQAFSQEREYIILSGGPALMEWEKFKSEPHDIWWMNFIRAARIRIEQLIEQNGPDTRITWLTYREGYKRRSPQENRDLIPLIKSVPEKYPNVKLVFFDRGSEVVNYLNAGQDRNVVKIANFEYFGHSNKACFMFDYSNHIDSASKSWLHENDLAQLRRGIFTRDAFIKSWGCHSGESMSQVWRDTTGTKMWGAVGKTRYQTHELPFISTPGGKWVN